MPYGPPLKFAPWLRPSSGSMPGRFGTPGPPGGRPGGITPSPPGRPSHNKPFIARVDFAEPRLRRFTEQVSAIFNSLLEQGQLKQTGAVSYEIDAAGGGSSGLTGIFP